MANKPEVKIRAGQVVATVWKNERKDGQDYDTYNVGVVKSYKDGEEWKETSNFNPNDLPKVALVCTKAFEHLNVKTE